MPVFLPARPEGSRRKPAPQVLEIHVMHFAEVGR